MDKQQKNPGGNTKELQNEKHEVALNPNPRANENVRERTEEPKVERPGHSEVGTEITDGEAG